MDRGRYGSQIFFNGSFSYRDAVCMAPGYQPTPAIQAFVELFRSHNMRPEQAES
jgi:hypothetical protein